MMRLLLLLLATATAAPAGQYACPPATGTPVVIDTSDATSTGGITISSAAILCTLTLTDSSSGTSAPVARSYDGKSWEVTAGPLMETLASRSNGGNTFVGLPAPETPSTHYVLTSYDHTGFGEDADATRFLQQTTFGPTRSTISDLVATGNDYEAWVTNQIENVPLSSHREYWRRRLNPRFEYSFYAATPGPRTACDSTSRWRTYALSSRDGIRSSQSKVSKYLTFKKVGNRYVWYVEGMARTSTSYKPVLKYENSESIVEEIDYYPTTVYQIHFNYNERYDCLGCPVKIVRFPGHKIGWIDNPKVDLEGIVSNSDIVPYSVVDLPNILETNGDMVSVDDGDQYQASNYFKNFHKAGDEFYLNATVSSKECRGHPDIASVGFELASKLELARNKEFNDEDNHVETMFPPIFGRTTNAVTNEVEYVLFDPHIQMIENTADNPHPDGGGRIHVESKAQTWCANAPRNFMNEDGCRLSYSKYACSVSTGQITNEDEKGVVVCGTVGEVANDITLGGNDGFDIKTDTTKKMNRDIYLGGEFREYKNTVWADIALYSKDQLRQRMAWALYQIIPIGIPDTDVWMTETWLQYYDIFVRNAFGNYRDVLKQISYSDVMAHWLSFTNNYSLQYNINKNGLEIFPDENYAREIMQLFSIGVFQLNMDGSKKLDENGAPLLTYTQTDIVNMARAWTGLSREYRHRGNAESGKWGPHVDPLQIEREGRDIYPKTDLYGGYLGDGYGLCRDLPTRHHLKKGAAYRLLGAKSIPELQLDRYEWNGDDSVLKLTLDSSSPLFEKLCAAEDGDCTFPGKIFLDTELDYSSDSAQAGEEFHVDTARVVRMEIGNNIIHYEYLRQPCVDHTFIGDNHSKKVIRGHTGKSKENPEAMCADSRSIVAAELCCNSASDNSYGFRNCKYHAERVKFSTAVDRCEAVGKVQCTPKETDYKSQCTFDIIREYWSSWTTASCMTRVKISYETGFIGRVDVPAKDFAGKRNVPNNNMMNLGDSTRNFFNIVWLSEPALPVDSASCESIAGCYSVTDGCVCNTNTIEVPVFTRAEEISSKADIVSAMKVGAFDPSQIDSINELGGCGVQGVSFYSQTSGESCSNFGPDIIVSYIDHQGAQKFLKNIQSVVTIDGLGDSFRNPPQFISMVDPDKRDMYYETDAVVDHFFHNPTHAPFLAIRIIQRFGISNPTPGFIERVSTAYATGSYKGIGSGSYGDLSAMVAAVLLDDESRSTTLDADPSHGQTREPLLKVLAFLKALAVNYTGPSGPHGLNGKLRRLGIGQDSYGSPSVFSFFLPEYQPSGAIEKANLVSPESQVLAGKQVTTLIDGLFTTVKFGMTDCYRGFGKRATFNKCPEQEGVTDDAIGLLDYTPPDGASMDAVLDDLSLLLTARRLGTTNTQIIRSAMKDAYDAGDEAKGIRIAQQLIASTPEFHSWGTVHHNSGTPRKIEGYAEKSEKKYKNVVFFFMAGGVDSYNLVVPVGGCGKNKDLYEEYKKARGDHAIDKEDLNGIQTSTQPCSEWGINKNFPILRDLYNDGDALFMLNMGILSKPLTKHDDWMRESNIILFAHNHMSKEQMLLDPFRQNSGTGVGGRMLDILKRNGYQTSGSTVDGDVLLMQGDSYYANPTTTIATGDIEELDQNSTLAKNQMFNYVKQLNGVGTESNSMMGDTWSEKVSRSLFEYETSLEIDAAIKSGVFNMDGYKHKEGPSGQFRAVAQFIKSRHLRKVDREVFFVGQEGYDMHGEDSLRFKFGEADDALKKFVQELKEQGVWDDTVILMGSDFGRSITPNSNGGTDHAWGGNYFMLGGGLDGGKILGDYPEDLSDKSDLWLQRGRLIPTLPFDSVWNGISEWMGVQGDTDTDFVLPNRVNFDKCSTMFRAQDLFSDIPKTMCIDDKDGDGVGDNVDECDGTTYWEDLPVDTKGCQEKEETQVPTVTSSPSESASPTQGPTPKPTNSPTASMSPTVATLVDSIDEARGYSMVYDLHIPTKPNFLEGVDYTTMNLVQPAFSRVAYLIELESSEYGQQYAWVSMDSFTSTISHTGIPCLACGQGTIQTNVKNVQVVSNVPGLSGTSLSGNLEFWPYSYTNKNTGNIPGASSDLFDAGDEPLTKHQYGSMQVHVDNPSNANAPRNTIFALNRFQEGVKADLGIGMNPSDGGQPDWTMASNSDIYSVKKLQVFVKAAEPAVCSPELWIGLKTVCGKCAALVDVRVNGKSCSAYCSNQGLTCINAWDDEDNNRCSLDAERLGCDNVFFGTSDAICQCESPTGPNANPVAQPTVTPVTQSTPNPTKTLTSTPTQEPSKRPTKPPVASPTLSPVSAPTRNPTEKPSETTTKNPTQEPSKAPTLSPVASPTLSPTKELTPVPTQQPSKTPTRNPTQEPSKIPTRNPTQKPSKSPTLSPIASPTLSPTNALTPIPTKAPTAKPTKDSPEVPTSVVCDPESWDDRRGPVCGECAALVKVPTNCFGFCASQGLSCTAGWDDDVGNTCSLDSTPLGCEHDFGYTRDAICDCNTKPLVCNPSSWIGFHGRACGECAALVKIRDNGGTCSAYCANQGLTCVDGWDDETNNKCSLDATRMGCDHSFVSTSDAICECGVEESPKSRRSLIASPTLSPPNAAILVPTKTPLNDPPSPHGDDIVASIDEANGYNMVYELDIPEKPNFLQGVDYTATNLDQPAFSRIAYFIQLESIDYGHQYVWVSMDSFTTIVSHTGVPCSGCEQGTIQTNVNSVQVVSNMPGLSGTNLSGNLEFFPSNYGRGNSANIPGASDTLLDSGDKPGRGSGYGCMQVHVDNPSNLDRPRNNIFSLNGFQHGARADLGIGGSPIGHPDWTFAQNTDIYSVKKLQVYVKAA